MDCNFKLSKNTNNDDEDLDFVDLTKNYSDSDDGMVIVELLSSDSDDLEDVKCDRRKRLFTNNFRNRRLLNEYKKNNDKRSCETYSNDFNSKFYHDKSNLQTTNFKPLIDSRKNKKNVETVRSSSSCLSSVESLIDLSCDDNSNVCDIGNNEIRTNLVDNNYNDSSKKKIPLKRLSKKSSSRLHSDELIIKNDIVPINSNFSVTGNENGVTSDSENNLSDFDNDFKNSSPCAQNISSTDKSVRNYESSKIENGSINISEYENGVTLDCEISIPSKCSDTRITSSLENSIYISGATMAAIQGVISFEDYMSNSAVYISRDFMASLHNIESLPGFITFMSSMKVVLKPLKPNETLAYEYLNQGFNIKSPKIDDKSFECSGEEFYINSEFNKSLSSDKEIVNEKNTRTRSNNAHRNSRTNPMKNKNHKKDKIISNKKFRNCYLADEEFQASFNRGSMVFSNNECNKTNFRRKRTRRERNLRSNTTLPDEEALNGYSTSNSEESNYDPNLERSNGKVEENGNIEGNSLPAELLNCGECGISISSLQHLDRHLERCRGLKRKKTLKNSQLKKSKVPNDFIPGKLYVVDTDDGEIIEGWSAPMGFIPPGPVCPRCAFDVPTLFDLPLHQKHHLGNEEVTCPICTFSTSLIPFYLLHVEDHAS